jgi:hypothetical protein
MKKEYIYGFIEDTESKSAVKPDEALRSRTFVDISDPVKQFLQIHKSISPL